MGSHFYDSTALGPWASGSSAHAFMRPEGGRVRVQGLGFRVQGLGFRV